MTDATHGDAPIRVLIADDHPVVRIGIIGMLEAVPADNIAVVGEAGNGREAVAQWDELRPDVALMDLRMPEMDGVEATQSIRERHLTARIIVLTAYDGDEDIFRGLKAGARGYLLKDATREQLLEAVRVVHSGRKYVPPAVAQKLAERADAPELSLRETEILALMAQGKSNRDIAALTFITEGTVKFHVSHILDKLKVQSRGEAVAVARKRGLVRVVLDRLPEE
jgi:DNA-binding NarL/FixJ family response regulator